MPDNMINIFIDHPFDSRKSYVASVADEFTHPMLDFLDATLPKGWRLSSDCWCKEICNPGS